MPKKRRQKWQKETLWWNEWSWEIFERNNFVKILGDNFPKKSGLLGKEMSNFCKQRGSPWFIIKVKIRWKRWTPLIPVKNGQNRP